MNPITSQPWMNTFETAFCEFDRSKLVARIGLAQAAIAGRFSHLNNRLSNDRMPHDQEEQRLMTHALRSLGWLRSSTYDMVLGRNDDEDEDEEDDEDKEPEEDEDETGAGYSE